MEGIIVPEELGEQLHFQSKALATARLLEAPQEEWPGAKTWLYAPSAVRAQFAP